jgi:hypothetical protein
MPKIEAIPLNDPERSLPALFRHAFAARTMLEKVWDDETAFQGIKLQPEDTPSRGQCGVSSVWFSRHLARQGVTAYFTEGLIAINDFTDEHVWVEVRGLGPEPYVADITSDQYRTMHGTAVHVGHYGDELVCDYRPQEHFDPYNIPHKKLMARYALLESKIARLPRRHQLKVR